MPTPIAPRCIRNFQTANMIVSESCSLILSTFNPRHKPYYVGELQMVRPTVVESNWDIDRDADIYTTFIVSCC